MGYKAPSCHNSQGHSTLSMACLLFLTTFYICAQFTQLFAQSKVTMLEYPPLSPTSITTGFQTFVNAENLRFTYPQQCADTGRSANESFYATFFTLGDWGIGDENQFAVAEQIGVAARYVHPCHIIGLGDNFYHYGVDDVESERWNNTFEDVYAAESLQNMTFFNVLGNHDYRENPWAQVARHYAPMNKRWFMPNYWYYTVHTFENIPSSVEHNPFGAIKFIKDFQDPGAAVTSRSDMNVTFVYIDTMILAKARQLDLIIPYDLDDPKMFEIHMKFLEDTLEAASKQPGWLFVVGHYHLLGGSPYLESEELKKLLIPLLKKYNVDAYLNGHMHYLGYNLEDNIAYITNGAGGMDLSKSDCFQDNCITIINTFGFTSHYLTKDKMYTAFVDSDGIIIASFEKTIIPKNEIYENLPPVRRVYIGPNPADSSPYYSLIWAAVGGFLCGVMVVIILAATYAIAVHFIRKYHASKATSDVSLMYSSMVSR